MSYLAIYLNDHLAGATGGVELARRLRASNRGDARFAPALERLCTELEEDHTALAEALDQLGVSRSLVKPAGAWLAEKLGRLKLNGRLRGYSPTSRLLELEGLSMGITGKLGLWKTLAEHTADGRVGLDLDLERLMARALAQGATVDELHQLAAAAVVEARPS